MEGMHRSRTNTDVLAILSPFRVKFDGKIDWYCKKNVARSSSNISRGEFLI